MAAGKIMKSKIKSLFSSKLDGIGVIEIILILVIIIALVLIFKNQITEIIKKAFDAISGDSNTIIDDKINMGK